MNDLRYRLGMEQEVNQVEFETPVAEETEIDAEKTMKSSVQEGVEEQTNYAEQRSPSAERLVKIESEDLNQNGVSSASTFTNELQKEKATKNRRKYGYILAAILLLFVIPIFIRLRNKLT